MFVFGRMFVCVLCPQRECLLKQVEYECMKDDSYGSVANLFWFTYHNVQSVIELISRNKKEIQLNICNVNAIVSPLTHRGVRKNVWCVIVFPF